MELLFLYHHCCQWAKISGSDSVIKWYTPIVQTAGGLLYKQSIRLIDPSRLSKYPY